MKIFRKKTDRTSSLIDNKNREAFSSTLRTIQQLLDSAKLSAQKASILEYAIDIIGKELTFSVPATMLRNGVMPENCDYTIPIPGPTQFEKGNYSLSGLNVISDPWAIDRLGKAIIHVDTDGFRQEYGHYTGIYYKEINLAVITNGKHHLSAAIRKGGGQAKLHVYNLSDAFSRLKTDGAYWYLDDYMPSKVFDYRIAILYELARIKYDLMLPENAKALEEKLFENEINQYRSDAYRQATNRISFLELEIAIKNYQIKKLKQQDSSKELPLEIQKLEEKCDQIRTNLDEWSKMYFDPWEHPINGHEYPYPPFPQNKA